MQSKETVLVQDRIWKIGGQAGEGIDTTGEMFAQAVAQQGFHYHTHRFFPSRIRGGHTSYEVRVGRDRLEARGDRVDCLLALDQDSIDQNYSLLHEGSIVVYDSGLEPRVPAGVKAVEMPLGEIAEEHGGKIMKNMVALGASARILGLSPRVFDEVLESRFGKKGAAVVEANRQAIQAGYDYAAGLGDLPGWIALEQVEPRRRYLVSGDEAVALGAMAAGCRFLAAYPITPATDIMNTLIDHLPSLGGVVVQAEDEIAAINMAIGAGYAGARAMTSTSGPGLALMTEALTLAVINETPVVVANVQRPGPATGLPTKTEQSDLNHAIFGGHGDAPRIVLAPGTVEECFSYTVHAFNLAEKYQTPVILMLDMALGMNKRTVDLFDLESIRIDRGALLTPDDLSDVEDYRRYRITESGVSPRSLPGMPRGVFIATGNEHLENGHITEDPRVRTAMTDKRLRKYESAKADLAGISVEVRGSEDSDVLVIGWGSSQGPLSEAVDDLIEEGLPLRHAQVKVLYPFPTEQLTPLVHEARRVLIVEQNATGQFARLLRSYVEGHEKFTSILKYDGTPLTPSELSWRIKEVL